MATTAGPNLAGPNFAGSDFASLGITEAADTETIRRKLIDAGWRRLARGHHASVFIDGAGMAIRLAPVADGLVDWISLTAAGTHPSLLPLAPPVHDLLLTGNGGMAVLMPELMLLGDHEERVVDIAMQFDWLPMMPREQVMEIDEIGIEMPEIVDDLHHYGPLLAELGAAFIDAGCNPGNLDIAPVNVMLAGPRLVVIDPVSGVASAQSIDLLAERLAAIGNPFPGFRASYAAYRVAHDHVPVMELGAVP